MYARLSDRTGYQKRVNRMISSRASTAEVPSLRSIRSCSFVPSRLYGTEYFGVVSSLRNPACVRSNRRYWSPPNVSNVSRLYSPDMFCTLKSVIAVSRFQLFQIRRVQSNEIVIRHPHYVFKTCAHAVRPQKSVGFDDLAFV